MSAAPATSAEYPSGRGICENIPFMAGKNRDYHKKLYRLVRILNRLETEGKVTPRELADEFNVSMRTAQRDIELINMAEFPLVSMTKGSYSFMPGFSLKRLPLTSEEASMLAFLCEVARSMGGAFAKSFKSLASKAVLSAGMDSPFHAISPVRAQEECPVMPDVRAAVEECRKIDINYANGSSHRLRPLKIIHSEGFWYLIAQRDGKTDCTTFRLDRIASVRFLDQTFEPPKYLAKTLGQTTSIWFGRNRDIRVLLKVDAEAAPYFDSAIFFPRQKKLKTQRDGAVLIETRISHFMEVMPVIQRWIPHIRVLRPRRLREEIKAAVREYLKGRP